MIRNQILSRWASLDGVALDTMDSTRMLLLAFDSYTEVLVIIPFLVSASSFLFGHLTPANVVFLAIFGHSGIIQQLEFP